MNRTWLWCSMILLSTTGVSGQLRLEQIPLSPVKSNTGFFVYGADNLKKEIPYSAIHGTPFWNTEFINATIYLNDGEANGTCPVKLNIATHEIHFLDREGRELVAQNGIIRKIVFHKRDDSGRVLTVFRNDIDLINAQSKYKGLYVEELNQGKTQLLKVSRKSLQVSDSLFGTKKKYAFRVEKTYFMMQNAKLYSLKKLSAKQILPWLYLDKPGESWTKKNAINFTSEKDILLLFDYLNNKNNQ